MTGSDRQTECFTIGNIPCIADISSSISSSLIKKQFRHRQNPKQKPRRRNLTRRVHSPTISRCKNTLINDCFLNFSDAVQVKQSQVDKLYASLKDLANERRGKLDEVLKLYMLNRDIDDIEQWIAEREVVAGSHELGQDFEHVTVSLQQR